MNDKMTTHDAIDALLPWYVNGTLGDTDRLRVQTHLDECGECRHSVAFLERLESRMLRIEPADIGEKLPESLRQQIEGGRDRTGSHPGRLAASVVLAFSLGIGGGLLVSDQAVYRTATRANATQETDSVTVRVRFTGETSMTDFGDFLREHDGVINAGPARDGWYELEIPKPSSLDADRFVSELSTSRGVEAIHRVNGGSTGTE